MTLEQALQQILSANTLFYKVLDQRTIIVIPDNPANRARYEEQVIQTFYISHADATELVQTLTNITRIAQMPVPPVIVPNRAANTITIRATTAMAAIIEQVIRANDKPRAEVVIDVEILEVNRQRAKQYGLNLSNYSIEGVFSPAAAPADSGARHAVQPQHHLGRGEHGRLLSGRAERRRAVPRIDSTTKVMAKPQLRGAEGQSLTLNLGEEIPVVSTTYTPIASGGAGINPLTSFSYRPVGINLEVTPRVTYEGDIVLELTVESSTRGTDVNVAGTSAPSFGSRRVKTKLRLRDGESNLLAGLLREDERKSLSGLPGLVSVPGLRSLFASNDNQIQQTDIVMLLTPRVIRTHELTQADLSPIFIGSQGNLGLTGAPPLIAAPPETEPAPAPAPGAPPVGAAAAPAPAPVAPPGSSPIPGTIQPAPGAAAAAQVLAAPPRRRAARGRRALPGADLDRRRRQAVHPVGRHDVQPAGAAGADGPGRQLHAAGRRQRHVRAAGGRLDRAHRHHHLADRRRRRGIRHGFAGRRALRCDRAGAVDLHAERRGHDARGHAGAADVRPRERGREVGGQAVRAVRRRCEDTVRWRRG